MKQRLFETPVELEATRGNVDGDPLESVTYTQARVKKAFPGFFFLFGRMYEFTYENGIKITLKRNNERLYSGQLDPSTNLEFAPKGYKSVVVHRIKAIRELPEE